MVRRMLAGTLLLTGVVLGQFGAMGWWFDREVADSTRVAEMTTTVLRDPEFAAAVSPLAAGRIVDAVPEIGADEDIIADAVAAALDDPAFTSEFAGAMGTIYGDVFEEGTDPVVVDLSTLVEPTARVLDPVDPGLADSVRLAGLSPDSLTLTMDPGDLPDLSGPAAVVRVAWMVLAGLGLALVAMGLLIHPRTARALRRLGLLVTVGAALQFGFTWLLTVYALPRLPDNGVLTATGVVLDVAISGWVVQIVAQAIVGLIVMVVGHLWLWAPRMTPDRTRPPSPRPATAEVPRPAPGPTDWSHV